MLRTVTRSLFIVASAALAQEQIDKNDIAARGAATQRLAVRVRVTSAEPAQPSFRIDWRRGGEGLGGTVTRGGFRTEDQSPQIPSAEWSNWLPLREMVGTAKGWEFPTVVVTSEPIVKGKSSNPGPPLTNVSVDFEFAEEGSIFKRITETAPKGQTVSFAFPGAALATKVTPAFSAQLNGISNHARERLESLRKAVPNPVTTPKLFGVIGRMGGYGDGPPGVRGSHGFGVRHCNPAILKDEFETLRLLGVNGMVDSMHLVDASGYKESFRHIFWGPPGSGEPMSFFQKGGKTTEPPDGCPFDPALKSHVLERTEKAIEEHRSVGAKNSWALWDDEMGVYAKEHIAHCERCAAVFRDYLKAQQVTLQQLAAKRWDDVKPYNLWLSATQAKDKAKHPTGLQPAPENEADALRYYYTYRLMSHANGQVFTEAAKRFDAANIKLYAMQGPTPSWNGSSLDWHEFYDLKPNSAFVFETSNRDARVWQWESYLADIGRGIASRHNMDQGCLIKPHRGAPAQRMLSAVSRGYTAFEWYSYGPDYSKGDSFSQSPELLVRVAKAAQFLTKAEPYLFDARPSHLPEVAFISPRSTEIWSRVTDPGLTAFEDAKWVYTALRHAHIPLDVLSEQQLIEAKLDQYKVIYIPGSHLHHQAVVALDQWVKNGGTLWTSASGLHKDHSNQNNPVADAMLGLEPRSRSIEAWGSAPQYRATSLEPLKEQGVPDRSHLSWNGKQITPRVGREKLRPAASTTIASFADGVPAITKHRHGRGETFVVGLWTGLTYSATVRREDFEMRSDFDPTLRNLIAAPALERKVQRPAIPSDPLVEALSLKREGRHSVALINWAYRNDDGSPNRAALQPIKDLRIELPGFPDAKKISSIHLGPLKRDASAVILPELEEIDLLIIQ
jgi:hypothetical protein